MANRWSDVIGTLKSSLRLGLSGVRLKDSSGALLVRNTGDSADAAVTASQITLSGTGLILPQVAAPSAPSGGVILSARNFGPFDLPAMTPKAWVDAVIAPPPFQWRYRELRPNAGTTPDMLGMPHNLTGSLSHPVLANTNLQTSLHRFQLKSGTGTGSSTATRAGITMCWRGDAAGLGGFLWFCRFSTSTAVAQQRMFVGLYDTTSLISNVNPSTLTNIMGFGYDSAGANINYLVNDASGTATATSCGANAPTDSTTVFDAYIACARNNSAVWFKLINRTTEVVALDWTSVSSDLPSTSTFLAPQLWCNNGTTASAVQLEIMSEVLAVPV